MPPKPKTLQKSQIPTVHTRSEAVDFFRSPLGILAVGMEPSEAFASLTPTARSFVLALVEGGGGNLTRAAMQAGYQGNNGTLQTHASRLASDPRVQRALMDIAMGLARSSSLLAMTELIKMIESPTLKERDKLAAISKLVSRIGLEPEKTVNLKHTVEMKTTKEQVAEIVQMSKELGIDPRKLLGRAGVIVDAEFSEVGTSAGLEDLLGE